MRRQAPLSQTGGLWKRFAKGSRAEDRATSLVAPLCRTRHGQGQLLLGQNLLLCERRYGVVLASDTVRDS